MGLDRAKQQAAMLVAQANEHLGSYGSEADLLRAIANYITERDR
jgi:farnesyl diphosphate synthase